MDVAAPEHSVRYKCLIRLPFPRGDFIDPPPVEWDAIKDRALWKIISKAANSKDLDWPELSNRFHVSLSFLLQQAAWLYERHFAQMRAQMMKLGVSNPQSPALPQESPASSTQAIATQPAQRPSSRGRVPSALTLRARDSPPIQSSSTQSSAVRPSPISRTPSTRTVTQSKIGVPPSPREASSRGSFRGSFGSQRRTRPALEDISAPSSSPPPASAPSSPSSSEEEDTPSMARSQAFRRPPHLRTISSGDDGDNDGEEDDDETSSGGFLPFAAHANEDPAATLRTSPPKKASFERPPTARAQTQQNVDSSASSASSTAAPPPARRTISEAGKAVARPAGSPADALSPRRRAELAKLSPRVKRDGSDGTPSMGSSFSDLDDASVTQSALEDALLSNMQGGMASRMSTISQALRSKYLQ